MMAAPDRGRRRFVLGHRAARDPLLPPWARPLPTFAAACNGCGRCASACPTKIIDSSGPFAVVDFARGDCTFCGRCVTSCPEGAFDVAAFDARATPWTLVAAIGNACLARNNVVCASCGDACEARAIRFRPVIGGVPAPALDPVRCTGCGACIRICPTAAITMVSGAAAPIPVATGGMG